MLIQFSIKANEKLALRNPETSKLGNAIVKKGLVLMHQLGYEHFTFKKLAETIGTTEASIYRYFENKHRLLLYFLTWYWNIVEYSAMFSTQNMTDTEQKIQKIIEILAHPLPEWVNVAELDNVALKGLAIAESSKTYLIKEVDDINKEQLFKPYKDLCSRIAQLFLEYNPEFQYPRSLASTMIEMSHFQPYFMEHLPSLTDFGSSGDENKVADLLKHFVFAALKEPVKE